MFSKCGIFLAFTSATKQRDHKKKRATHHNETMKFAKLVAILIRHLSRAVISE